MSISRLGIEIPERDLPPALGVELRPEALYRLNAEQLASRRKVTLRHLPILIDVQAASPATKHAAKLIDQLPLEALQRGDDLVLAVVPKVSINYSMPGRRLRSRRLRRETHRLRREGRRGRRGRRSGGTESSRLRIQLRRRRCPSGTRRALAASTIPHRQLLGYGHANEEPPEIFASERALAMEGQEQAEKLPQRLGTATDAHAHCLTSRDEAILIDAALPVAVQALRPCLSEAAEDGEQLAPKVG
mmetsp:Transcript_58974/g.133180  ORF Transcript_58974/g.133180 Transcript_58974/m.133180 type:complete len:246 (-) Transcript_58974:1248-1985(-)